MVADRERGPGSIYIFTGLEEELARNNRSHRRTAAA
jgi:hypothetical protein